MKKALLIVLSLMLLFTSCEKEEERTLPGADSFASEMKEIDALPCPETLPERFSYAYGNLFRTSIEGLAEEVSPEYFMKGFLDATGEPYFSESEMEQIFIEYQSLLISEAQSAFDEAKEKNRDAADEFLRVNKMRTGVHVTSSGLQYEKIRESATEPCPTSLNTVVMDYTMTLLNGSVIESSYDRASRAVVRVSELPSGFAEGISMMSPGDKYRFWIPPELAFGEDGTELIGPSELIIFEVTLHEVQ